MKRLQKFIFYIIAIVLLITFGLYAFHFHPEVQIVFLLPGIFLIIYAAIINDFPSRSRTNARNRHNNH